MALKFTCTNCGTDIVVQFLKVGDKAKCHNCGAAVKVPENAANASEDEQRRFADNLATDKHDVSQVLNRETRAMQSPTTSAASSPPDVRYKGVRGWLLFLCVNLTILGPIGNAMIISASFAEATVVSKRYPSYLPIEIIGDVLVLAVNIVYSIYVGIRLWRVRPNAVDSAKNFLILAGVVAIVNMLLLLLAGFSEEVLSAVMALSLPELGPNLAIIGLWYRYLNRSKRVRATFGLAQGPVAIRPAMVARPERLPESVVCPNCSAELSLDDTERKTRQFTCPACKTRTMVSERLPKSTI